MKQIRITAAVPQKRLLWRGLSAPVRGREVQFRPDWNNAGRVDRLVAGIVMPADMIEVYRRSNPGELKQIAGVTPEIGIIDEPAQITFEVADIDGIETDERSKETPIGLDRSVAEKIAGMAETFFKLRPTLLNHQRRCPCRCRSTAG